jgi:hypothetical protein
MSPRPAKVARPILTIYTVSLIEVPSGGLNASKNFQEVHFPLNLQIWTENRDFQLKQNH